MKSIPFNHVRSYYDTHQPAGFWFTKGALAFFKSKIPSVAYETTAGILFVTRETSPSGVTAYTVRRQKFTGSIDTVGEFHRYPTAAAARAEIKRLDTLGA